MGLSWRGSLGVTTATAFPGDRYRAGPDRNADLGGIGGGVVVVRRARPNTARGQCVSVPGVIAKDAVGLGDDMPAFDIGEGGILHPPRPDVFGIELGLEVFHLALR